MNTRHARMILSIIREGSFTAAATNFTAMTWFSESIVIRLRWQPSMNTSWLAAVRV